MYCWFRDFLRTRIFKDTFNPSQRNIETIESPENSLEQKYLKRGFPKNGTKKKEEFEESINLLLILIQGLD